MKLIRTISFAALFSLNLAGAHAEEMGFRVIGLSSGHCGASCPRVIAAEGEIGEETPGAFTRFVHENFGAGNRRGIVLLDSPGGKVVASMELGAAIRRLGMAVIIARPAGDQSSQYMALVSGRCYSACVYALMGGMRRVVPPESRVGVHRMFNDSTSFSLSNGFVSERNYDDGGMRLTLARYASGMGVSRALVYLAERTSSDRLYMLSGADIARWHLAARKL